MNGPPRLFPVVLCLSAALAAPVAGAAIIDTTGPVFLIAPPESVTGGALESDTDIRVFAKVAGMTLDQSFAVNIKNPGTYAGNGSSAGTLAAGLLMDSHMVHTDLQGRSGSRTYEGSITFDADILAVITSASRLDTSDAVVGLPSVL